MKKLNVLAILAAAASLAAIPTASAQDVTCDTANFSSAVMDSFPGIRNSCLDIIVKDGSPHAVLNAEVTRVRQATINLKFKRRDGGYTNAIQFRPDSEQRFEVEGGRNVRARDLSVSSQIRVYVPVEAPEPRIAFVAPTAAATTAYYDFEESEEELGASLPKTASNMPMFALLGGLFLAIAGGMAMRRRQTSV
jgi:LPXTG-motif cell wall-anchored protein